MMMASLVWHQLTITSTLAAYLIILMPSVVLLRCSIVTQWYGWIVFLWCWRRDVIFDPSKKFVQRAQLVDSGNAVVAAYSEDGPSPSPNQPGHYLSWDDALKLHGQDSMAHQLIFLTYHLRWTMRARRMMQRRRQRLKGMCRWWKISISSYAAVRLQEGEMLHQLLWQGDILENKLEAIDFH